MEPDQLQDLLDKIGRSVGKLNGIGRPFVDAKPLAEFETHAFDGNRRKSVVGGSPITWISKAADLQSALLAALPCGSGTVEDAMNRVQDALEAKAINSPTVRRRKSVDDDQLGENGWLLVDRRRAIEYLNPGGSYVEYAVVGTEFAALSLEFKRLKDRVGLLPSVCLAEGRVLAVEETETSTRLLLPAHWSPETPLRLSKRSLHFVLTNQLPRIWLNRRGGRRTQEKLDAESAALEWIENLYDEVAPFGFKVMKHDAFAQFNKRFGISNEAAQKRVWKKANIPLWKRGGLPAANKVYHFD